MRLLEGKDAVTGEEARAYTFRYDFFLFIIIVLLFVVSLKVRSGDDGSGVSHTFRIRGFEFLFGNDAYFQRDKAYCFFKTVRDKLLILRR